MKTNENIKWQEEQALQRYQLIAPLLDGSLDNAKRIQLRDGSSCGRQSRNRTGCPHEPCTAMKRLTGRAGSPG